MYDAMCMPMLEPVSYVGVAFLRGDARRLCDRIIMDATFGSFVHTEFFLQNGAQYRFYTAANIVEPNQNPSGFMPSAKLRQDPDPKRWDVVRFRVSRKGYLLTYSLILQLLALQLPYNARDLWQCSIRLLLPYERDLDCCRFETWRPSGVFCSQVCLLLLRRLLAERVVSLPLATAERLHATNSRGCSPNMLRRLLQ